MEKTRIFILPLSEAELDDDVLFEKGKYEERGGFTNMAYFWWFKQDCEKRGVEVHTVKHWSRGTSQPGDILFVQNHPGEPWLWRLFYFLKHPSARGGFMLARRKFLYENYKFFKKRVLWHIESPVSTPYVYDNMDKISASGVYQKIILLGCPPRGTYKHIDWYSLRERNLESIYFKDPKDKFLVMINSNTAPHRLGDDFYGERLRAMRYLSEIPDSGFDLYGHRWDKRPRHPGYLGYKKYVDKVWRGRVDDKLKVLSEYKFSLCFENCSYPGYISEKIFDCLAAGTIPVYLGAPDITSIVPQSCFIDFKQFKDYDELMKHLHSLTTADLERYRSAILTFLRDDSSMKGMGFLIDEICAA